MEGIAELLRLAEEAPLCLFCSEALPWRCHRLIISNTLVSRGIEVVHILGRHETLRHEWGKFGAKPELREGHVVYPKSPK